MLVLNQSNKPQHAKPFQGHVRRVLQQAAYKDKKEMH